MTVNAPTSSGGLSTVAGPPNSASMPANGPPSRPVTPPAVERHAAVRPEVVLREVVGQQQAVGGQVAARRDHALLLGRAVEAVVDAAEPGADEAVVADRLAGEHELAALVEEVAHGHRQVLLALGHRAVLVGPAEQFGQEVLGILRQAVVAVVPDDGGVVAEDAEVVRNASGVDVPDVGRDPVRLQRGDVLVDVLRCVDGVVGVDAGVVLVGDDQDRAVGVAGDGVREPVALDPAELVPIGGQAAEPHLHLVTR